MHDTEVREAWILSEYSLADRQSEGFIPREPSADELLAVARFYESHDRALNHPDSQDDDERARWARNDPAEEAAHLAAGLADQHHPERWLDPADPFNQAWFEVQREWSREHPLEASKRALAAKLADQTAAELRAAFERQSAERSQRIAELMEQQRIAEVSTHDRAVIEQVAKLRVLEDAKRILAIERASFVEVPEGRTLANLLATELESETFILDRLWLSGGNVVSAAQRKAGKTTMVHNLVRALVDGDDFLDHFAVKQTRRVALLDFELGEKTFQRWLGRQRIKNQDAVGTWDLRGKAASFNILDDRIRARWAERLSGYDVLILDPLRPILDALGVNEWNETGPFLQAFDALKVEAGISEGLINQHHGHHAERAAGDSRLEGWPDSIWNLTRDDVNDPRSFRYFAAFGRDVDVDKGLLGMYDDNRLSFSADASTGKRERLIDLVIEALSDREMKADDITALGIRGVSKNTVRPLLEAGLSSGLLKLRVGDKGAKFYAVA